MKRPNRDGRQTGFTLLELLIGTFISAVLLAALYSIFQGLVRTQAHAYAVIEETVPRMHLANLLKKDMENILPPNGILSGNILGQGNAEGSAISDTLEFYTSTGRIGATEPWGDIQKVRYYLASEEETQGGISGQTHSSVGLTPATPQAGAANGLDLVRETTRNLLAVNADDAPDEKVLLSGVSALEFEYYDGQEWSDSWDSTAVENASPKAVRMIVRFEPQEAASIATMPLEIVCEVAAQNTVSQMPAQ